MEQKESIHLPQIRSRDTQLVHKEPEQSWKSIEEHSTGHSEITKEVIKLTNLIK